MKAPKPTGRTAAQALTFREMVAANAAMNLGKCFPCGASFQGKAPGIGLFTHPSNSRSMVYPLCRACCTDYMDPKQTQAVAKAIHRRFVKLGEVTP